MADKKKKIKQKAGWADFLHLDESYVSLLLGIIVVVAASILLVSFIKSRQTQNFRQETSSISVAPVIPPKERTYIVQSGDSLWNIAEKVYGSGYNWVDIANANNLVNPGSIYAGNVLELPKITPTITQHSSVIMPSTYVVQKGDSLWTIAQRVYNGNGNQWVNIASANHLANPDLIFSGNVLTIPRK